MEEEFKQIKSKILISCLTVLGCVSAWSILEDHQFWSFCIGTIGLIILAMSVNELTRKQYLWTKYRDKKLVDRLYNKYFWQGQTAEQLKDSIGSPVDIDRKVLKTKTKETWKYGQYQKGCFRQKVFLEDGYVVGWEQKS